MTRKLTIKDTRVRFAVGAAVIIAAVLFLLVPVSGANFSASGSGQVDVGTAKLSLGLSDGKDSVGTFDLDFVNLKPGESQSQTIEVTNTGSIGGDATLGLPLAQVATKAGLSPADLAELKVSVVGQSEATSVDKLPAVITLGSLTAGETKTYEVKVSLDQSAGNEWQDVHIGTAATVVLEQN